MWLIEDCFVIDVHNFCVSASLALLRYYMYRLLLFVIRALFGA